MKLLVILIFSLKVTWGQGDPIVNIPLLGKVQGSEKISFKGQRIFSFEGVPYAHPPVGKYRFREPLPPKPWHGIWQAKTIYKCMQNNQYAPPGDSVLGDEDCLYLNIYTPTLSPIANLDVILYIHGGAFMFNYGGIYQPDFILDKNVVYINLNYRLGPLGFLSTEDDIVPGNNGLKDQILGLEWVKDNVKYFGGNPNSVTIFGMSAGGASVHFHYLSPKSRGLFHRGISQSGTMLNCWTLQEQPLQKSKKLATTLGCPTKDLKLMIDCLRRRPGLQIVAAVKKFQPWLYNPFSPFAPVVDSWSSDPLLTDHPFNLIKNKKVADLPWIASYTNSEGLYPATDFYFDPEYLKDIDTKWNEITPHILDYNFTVDSDKRDVISQKIREYYLGDKSVNRDNFMDFVKIVTDRMFAVDIEKTVKLQAPTITSPVYVYHFAYRGAHSRSEFRSGSDKDFGASHGDDMGYIFKTFIDTASTEKDRLMIELLTEMVASFAKEGQPNVPIEWLPSSRKVGEKLSYLKVTSPTDLIFENSTLESQSFWDSLLIIENEKLFSAIRDEL